MRRDQPPASALRASLEKVLAKDSAQRLFAVERILEPTFEAFPKNSAGKIEMQALHSMARGYFAEEHGWLFKGFEFAAARSTRLQQAQLLREKVPELVLSLEQAQTRGDGFSLSDVVAAVAAVEHLVLEESVSLLHRAYELNEVPLTGAVQREGLEDILSSYLLLFRDGRVLSAINASEHKAFKAESQKRDDWISMTNFTIGAVNDFGTSAEYGLRDATKIVQDMALRYGKWQNSECDEMKQVLLKLAGSNDTGRVPFNTFHSAPKHSHFNFGESIDYLRKNNVLDESSRTPQVMIANYLASPSNCIAWSQYFSVCCLNECENLVNVLESKVETIDVPVGRFLDAVATISSGTVTAPRLLPQRLWDMAKAIASAHGGVVPLQSGDFRRWFHYAFPNECPFPTDVEAQAVDGERDASEKWLGKSQIELAASGVAIDVGAGHDHQET